MVDRVQLSSTRKLELTKSSLTKRTRTRLGTYKTRAEKFSIFHLFLSPLCLRARLFWSFCEFFRGVCLFVCVFFGWVWVMASAVAYVMPAMAAVGSGAHNVAAAPRSQTKRATSSSTSAATVASSIALPFRASRRCLEQKSGFFSGLALVSLFPGSSSFRAGVYYFFSIAAGFTHRDGQTETDRFVFGAFLCFLCVIIDWERFLH
jgi:hypothetical protein